MYDELASEGCRIVVNGRQCWRPSSNRGSQRRSMRLLQSRVTQRHPQTTPKQQI